MKYKKVIEESTFLSSSTNENEKSLASVSSQMKVKEIDSIPTSRVFFYDVIDPNDNEGWISVKQNQNKVIKNKLKEEKYSHRKFQNNNNNYQRIETGSGSILNEIIKSPLPRSKDSNEKNEKNQNHNNKNNIKDKEDNDCEKKEIIIKDNNDNSIITNDTQSSSISLSCENCLKLESNLNEFKNEYTTQLDRLKAQHHQEINELHHKYQEEINELRELHSQALQSIHLKLYIALTNLDNERENRNKIIEDSLLKYYQNTSQLKFDSLL